MVDFPAGVSATDPTFLLGANATDPAKTPLTPFGQTVIDRADAGALRTLAGVPTFSTIGADVAAAADGAAIQALIGIPNPIGARVGPNRFTHMEQFPSGTVGLGLGMVSSTSGGANTSISIAGRCGVLRSSTGTTATADRRAGVLGAATGIDFGVDAYRIIVCMAPTIALFTGVLTGAIRIGFLDSVTAESMDGAFFRSTNGDNWFAVTRSNNTETATDTGIAIAALDVYSNFDVRLNAAGTEATFYIDDVLVATNTTNIPTGETRATGVGFFVTRTVATGTNVGAAVDWLYFDTIYATSRGFSEIL